MGIGSREGSTQTTSVFVKSVLVFKLFISPYHELHLEEGLRGVDRK